MPPYYSKLEIENFEQKDKRISFQSIFSSLCDLYKNEPLKDSKEIAKIAHGINNELWMVYPNLKEDKDLIMKDINASYKAQEMTEKERIEYQAKVDARFYELTGKTKEMIEKEKEQEQRETFKKVGIDDALASDNKNGK